MRGLYLIDHAWTLNWLSKRNTFSTSERPLYEAGYWEEKEKEILAKRKPVLELTDEGALIHINGSLTESGPDWIDLYLGFEGASYSELIDAVYEADSKLPRDKGIILKVNTPGGEFCTGVEMLSEAVKEVAAKRNVTTYNMGLLASAGVWITAHSTEIVSFGSTPLTGSIGVACRITDFSSALEAGGIKIYNLTNPESKDKRPDISTEEGRNVIIKELQGGYKLFLDNYLEGREGRTSKEQVEAVKGGVLLAQEALSRGFIDRIETASLNSKESDTNQPAAIQAGGKRGQKMKLEDLLKEHPDAAAELEKRLVQARTEGSEAEREATANRSERMNKFIESDKYPKQIKDLAVKAISGGKSVDSVEDMAAMYEALLESNKSTAAEQEMVEDVPSIDGTKIKGDMQQKSVDAETALINEMLG